MNFKQAIDEVKNVLETKTPKRPAIKDIPTISAAFCKTYNQLLKYGLMKEANTLEKLYSFPEDPFSNIAITYDHGVLFQGKTTIEISEDFHLFIKAIKIEEEKPWLELDQCVELAEKEFKHE